jgi:hypothetical protein
MIYKERPKLCRSYEAEDCERNGEGSCYKLFFGNAKDLEKYLKKRGIDWKYKRLPP